MSSPTRDRAALAARARQITERELEAYGARTTKSQAANARAAKVLPLGVPSSFQSYDPHPVVARRAQGSWIEDVDGNRYVDFDMGFGALFAGHGHPAGAQGDRGAARRRHAVRHAVRAQRRRRRAARRALRLRPVAVHQLAAPRRRWTPIRVARGVTGRDEDRQGRGRLPRPPRRGDGLDEAAARRGRSGRRADRRARDRRHHAGRARRHDRHPLQRPRRARAGARGAGRRRCLHRRAGDGEHRHLPARARLPRGRPRDHRTSRHDADLRRGEDRHHRRLRRRHRRFGVQPDLVCAGQVDRRRPADRRVRRRAEVHGPDHRRARCSTSARTTATRW